MLVGRPDLELDPRNLLTLCIRPDCEHHVLLGHLDDYESYNPKVLGFVKAYAASPTGKSGRIQRSAGVPPASSPGEDVLKTQIPLPDGTAQDKIAKVIRYVTAERERTIKAANAAWKSSIDGVIDSLEKSAAIADAPTTDLVYSVAQIAGRVAILPAVEEEETVEEEILFEDSDNGG